MIFFVYIIPYFEPLFTLYAIFKILFRVCEYRQITHFCSKGSAEWWWLPTPNSWSHCTILFLAHVNTEQLYTDLSSSNPILSTHENGVIFANPGMIIFFTSDYCSWVAVSQFWFNFFYVKNIGIVFNSLSY